MTAAAEKCHGDLTVRDYEEMLRASNILHRVATLRNSPGLMLMADYVMLYLTADDTPIRGDRVLAPASEVVTIPVAERLAELEAFVAKLRVPRAVDDRPLGVGAFEDLMHDVGRVDPLGVTAGEIRRVKR